MGRLFGLNPAAPDRARVLEIGCGDGLNLIAAALVLQKAAFVGIDISREALNRGRETIRALGLRNVQLKNVDLSRVAAWRKRFDYVVAHGLYSWIPSELRFALLQGIRHVLAPQGIAFISYNAYPGAYLRQMARETVRISVGRNLRKAQEWLHHATISSLAPEPYRAVLEDEFAEMRQRDPGALFHDDLSEINQPFYFYEFIGHAAAAGLQYLSEADLRSTAVVESGNRIAAEQYADLMSGRRFRQTLLCHAGLPVRSQALSSALEGTFVCAMGVDGNVPETIAEAWPQYVPASQLGDSETLLALLRGGRIDVRTVAPPVAASIGKHPEVSPLARLQVARDEAPTSLHHFEIAIGSDSLRQVLLLADGTRTRAGLIRDLAKLYPDESKTNVAVAVDTHLEDLRRYGLLLDRGRNVNRSRLKVTRAISAGLVPRGR